MITCGKLIHSHSEQQLKDCDKIQDKRRQAIGRKAFSQCVAINPSHPEYVAEKMGELYEACKMLLDPCYQSNGHATYPAIVRLKQALADIERGE